MNSRFHMHVTLHDDKDSRIRGHRCLEEPSVVWIDDFCVDGDAYSKESIDKFLQTHHDFLARNLEPRFSLKRFTISEIRNDRNL